MWYEVDRVGDLEGNASRSLLFGTLGGELRPRIVLAEDSAADGNPEGEPFGLTDPQTDGIFSRRVVVWGRANEYGLIESVDLHSGAIEPLLTTDGIVHVATADADLKRLFFITVDAASQRPIGLWIALPGEVAVTGLTYSFPEEPVSSQFVYRLVANTDGSLLAVQPMEGPVTIIDVDSDLGIEVHPGGPMIGFVADALVAYGPPSATGARALVTYDPEGTEQVIAPGVNSAHIVPGTDGAWVAAMRTSEVSAAYEIEAIDLSSGGSGIVYSHEGEEIGPLLARRDRSFLGYELPPDWALLVDSFVPFVRDPTLPARDPPLSTYPLALNLRTGETIRLGPFVPDNDE